MILIGMLDSPFVRRVAVGLNAAGVAFEHKPLSVFRHFEAFRALSPTVKAPSLIAHDGSVLVDSNLILDYLATRAPALAALRPRGAPAFALMGLALIAMEKAVQIHYERALRGPGERSETWRERVTGQFHEAFGALEGATPEGWIEPEFGHADIAVACAWTFARSMIGDAVDLSPYPRLAAFAARAEALPAFLAAPAADGVTAGARR